MDECNFKVAAPWHHQLMIWIPFSMFAFLLISMGIRAGYPVQSVGMVVGLFLLSFFASLSTVLFCIQVKGETVRVRTSFGKRYEIRCEDISKVVCIKKDSVKYGPQFYLTVAAQQREFTLDGNIKQTAVQDRYILNTVTD